MRTNNGCSSLAATGQWLAALMLVVAATHHATADAAFSSASGGYRHTCALDDAGRAYCWGSNDSGQLGDGTYVNRDQPALIASLAGNTTAISAGSFHSCAVSDGAAWCWGANISGQLGDGTSETYEGAPVAVSGLTTGATDVAAGVFSSCAVVGGAAKCWGDNTWGELGNGATSGVSLVPVDVVGLSSGVSDIAVGVTFACAVVDGAAMCWGSNQLGQLGNGSNIDSAVPVAVAGLTSGVSAIVASSYAACALVAGGAKCWGDNTYAQLGNGDIYNSTVPVDVVGLQANVTQIALGQSSACATDAFGAAYCWGEGATGNLGIGTYGNSRTPVQVVLPDVALSAIADGAEHACGIGSGELYCWGSNTQGELGIGSDSRDQLLPVDTMGLGSLVTALSAADFNACAIIDGEARCWGDNRYGVVGDGTTTVRGVPTTVASMPPGATAISVGSIHTCAVAAGAAYCWGLTALGDGSDQSSLVPVPVSGLSGGVTAIHVGYAHSCAIANGLALCWGSDGLGQLGNGTPPSDQLEPVQVEGVTAPTLLATGALHSCAVVAGGVKCWGSNFNGELGSGSTAMSSATPVDVTGLSSVTSISAEASGNFTCAVAAGGVWCWGQGTHGELGNGDSVDSAVPVAATGLESGVVAVYAGSMHACALMATGTVECWGSGSVGEVGVLPGGTYTTPVVATTFPPGITSMALGTEFTCGIANGASFCVGSNRYAQLGNGGVPFVLLPAAVTLADGIFADGFE